MNYCMVCLKKIGSTGDPWFCSKACVEVEVSRVRSWLISKGYKRG